MKEYQLKYGLNPCQKNARVFVSEGEMPFTVLNGRAGYINLLDALNGWALVRELKKATGLVAAASFKHVSPAGAAVGLPLTDTLRSIYFTGGEKGEEKLSPLACAYARARGADRMSSFGDFISLSEPCDVSTARLIQKEVSDGIIAPAFDSAALDILKAKKKGQYTIIQIDKDYTPPAIERKDVFGITFEEERNSQEINEDALSNVVTKRKDMTAAEKRDLVIALITLKYTQSNSVSYAKDGQAIGIGAGQQSRVHCTRLAGGKADNWHLRQAEQVLSLPFADGIKRADRDNAIDVYIGNDSEDILADGKWQRVFKTRPAPFTVEEKTAWLAKQTGVALASDAFFPFSDNIDRAHKSGVTAIAEPGGSIRDEDVIEAADDYGMAMAFTGIRLFTH